MLFSLLYSARCVVLEPRSHTVLRAQPQVRQSDREQAQERPGVILARELTLARPLRIVYSYTPFSYLLIS